MKLEFQNKEETKEAEAALLIYLPQMLWQFEKGLKMIGATILKKLAHHYDDGGIELGYLLVAGDNRFDFRLGNALKELLSIDRDEQPMRFDYQLKDMDAGMQKLENIVVGRLELLRTMIESKDKEEFKRRMEGLGRYFDRMRFWYEDEEEEKGGAHESGR